MAKYQTRTQRLLSLCGVKRKLTYEDEFDRSSRGICNKRTRSMISSPAKSVTSDMAEIMNFIDSDVENWDVSLIGESAQHMETVNSGKCLDHNQNWDRNQNENDKDKSVENDANASEHLVDKSNEDNQNAAGHLQDKSAENMMPSDNSPKTSSVIEKDSDKTPMKENGRRKTRKRQRNPKTWQKNIRKEKVNKGEAHVSVVKGKKKIIPAKHLKSPCSKNCLFKCASIFNDEKRSEIFKNFYTLNYKEKNGYILSNVQQYNVKPRGKADQNKKQRKQKVYKYFLPDNDAQIQICKKMFLNTLSISSKKVFKAHETKLGEIIPNDDKRGTKSKDRISIFEKNRVREHIKMFPTVESHYCRAKTNKQYLDPRLNISRMYRDYRELYKNDENPPCKESFYRFIFNTEFNLDFLMPKSDKCEVCEEKLLAQKENRMTEELKKKYEEHERKKNLAREEKQKDKQQSDKTTVVLSFDLQNVILLPHTDIGVAFYKRKLSEYNLTAHAYCRKDNNEIRKESYCAIWNEGLCGRSGNDICSAVYKIMTRVVSDFKDVKKIIGWSDSCVPQNRNKMISMAMAQFLKDHPNIEWIKLKYSLPGHGCVQEVDNIHSQIEKALKLTEAWSPISLIRILLKVNQRKPFNIIQMTEKDFIDFDSMTKGLRYFKVPYFKVAELMFLHNRRFSVFYKECHGGNEYVKVFLKKKNCIYQLPSNIEECPRSEKKPVIALLKIRDIESLYNVMPKEDKLYYQNCFKRQKNAQEH